MWSVCEKCWNFDPASRPSISSLVDELERIRLAEVTLDDEETTDSLEITIPVMDVNEELEMHPIPRPSSAELLNSVLFSRPAPRFDGKSSRGEDCYAEKIWRGRRRIRRGHSRHRGEGCSKAASFEY